MSSKAFKEYTPVMYPESAVKVLYSKYIAPKKVAFSLHWHERMEITRVVSGDLIYTADDNTFTLTAGSVAVSEPDRPHGAIAGADGAVYYTVMFNISDFYNQSLASKRYLSAISEGLTQFCYHTDDPQVVDAIDAIIDADSRRDRTGALLSIGGVYSFLALLYEKCLLNESAGRTADARFKEVFDHIEAHYTENLTSANLSNLFGYNEAYFCRRFKEIAGISAMKYISILRLEKAADMLKEQDNVGEVAVFCGFCNISHFSNCFKKHFGISPSEYRNRAGE